MGLAALLGLLAGSMLWIAMMLVRTHGSRLMMLPLLHSSSSDNDNDNIVSTQLLQPSGPPLLPAALADVTVPTGVNVFALPQFMIIGVQKCGTSALYFALAMHPNVTASAFVKVFVSSFLCV